MNDRPKMNQRLSAIKQQAHLYALDQEWYVDSFEQRFAELIVRECLEACSRANEIRHFVPPTQEQVVLSCMREIEEHFGVEE